MNKKVSNVLQVGFKKVNGELNENMMNVEPTEWLDETTMKSPSGKLATINPLEIGCEIHNRNDFEVYFENIHPDINKRKQGDFILKLDGFHVMPHKYFTPHIQFKNSGIKGNIQILENYGKLKGKKNKLPSKLTK